MLNAVLTAIPGSGEAFASRGAAEAVLGPGREEGDTGKSTTEGGMFVVSKADVMGEMTEVTTN